MKAIWNNSYTHLEWKFLKITLVVFWLILIFKTLMQYYFIPMPTGVLCFLKPNTTVDNLLKSLCLVIAIIAVYFYINDKLMILATLILFFISVFVFTIEESNGILKRNGLFSFIFFAQFLAYAIHQKYFDSNIEKNRVQFSVQVIAIGYTLSGLSKLYVSGFNWILDAKKMPLQIMKSFSYSYVDEGNYYYVEKGNEIINSFNNNLYIIYFLLGFSLFLELSALISILSKKHALVIGLLLLTMHIGIFIYMNITIVGIIYPMLIVMLNPFYIIYTLVFEFCQNVKLGFK